MNINKLKLIVKERWKFYIIGYAIGYFMPLILEGVPSWHYLLPFRMMGIVGALGVGTAFYYGSKKTPVFEIAYRSIKYAVFMVILFIIAFAVKELVLAITGYDITPLIGIPQSTK